MKNTQASSSLEKSSSTKVAISMPDEIGIELVQANESQHYELFSWLSGLMTAIAVGFWTAIFTTPNPSNSLKGSAIVFTLCALLFFGVAMWYRRKVYHGSIVKKAYFEDFK